MASLQLRGLSKAFGATRALDQLDLTVGEGRIVGFVGANGAGKTTAMRIALGVLAADGGEVLIDGRPADHESRARIGYMPEERGLYPKMRVGEQVEHFACLHGLQREAAREAARAAVARVGLEDRWDTEMGELSLGNQQRAQLAVALAHGPEVLILDEPFSGLDPIGVDVLAEVLRERAAAGVPVLFSSHQLDLVERLCDEVAIIRAGRIVDHGTVAELRRGGERRVVVEVEGADPGWAGRLPGVRLVRADGPAVVLALDGDADDQAVLDAARAAGAVRRFAPDEVHLTERYREVVA